MRGLEPPRSFPLAPEASASTNFATWAKVCEEWDHSEDSTPSQGSARLDRCQQTIDHSLLSQAPQELEKTDLAMVLGTEVPLKVISADSVMVYQHLDIGSAKPTAEELAECPHDLIDLVPPEHAFDAGQFVTHAEMLIQCAWDQGQVPCLVGGTIMYLKSLLNGLDPLPAADPVIREKIRGKAELEGGLLSMLGCRSLIRRRRI